MIAKTCLQCRGVHGEGRGDRYCLFVFFNNGVQRLKKDNGLERGKKEMVIVLFRI